MEIMILCLRPLPAANGGWNSAKWRIPKLAAPVNVRPVQVSDWLAALSAQARLALKELLAAPFVAALRLDGPAASFEVALAYAGVVAEACAGVVLQSDELAADRRASVHVWSGPQIEQRWRAIDAEAARSEPGYQPVRGAGDDQRPTQTFAFPIVIDGVEITAPMARSAMAAGAAATAAATAAAASGVGGVIAAGEASSAGKSGATAVPVAAAPEGEGTAPMSAEMVQAALAAAPERERIASGSAPPPSSSAAAEGASMTVRVPALLPAPVPAQAMVQVPALPVTSRAITGDRRAAVIAQLDDVASEQTYDSATSAGDDDWSEVMPE